MTAPSISPAPHVAAALAALVTAPEFTARADEQQGRASDVLLDTIAVCAHAATLPTILATTTEICGAGQGIATLLGTLGGGSPVAAAIANGMAANATLLCEGHRGSLSHPAAHIVPALLACAESHATTGRTLLRALVAGYEVATRVADLVPNRRPGLSASGNFDTIGAAAAVAYAASDAHPIPIAHAIDAAAAATIQAPMTFGHQGADTYKLFVGLGAGAALAAGLSAAAHWKSPGGTLAEWFAGLSGAAANPPVEFREFPAIVDNYFKRYGVCAQAIAAIDVVCALRDEHGLDPAIDELRAVDVRCGNQSASELPLDVPENNFAARYSIPTTTAVAWWNGADALMFLPDDVWRQPYIAYTAAKTTVTYDRALAPYAVSGRPTSVTLRLADGRSFQRTVQVPRGDRKDPFTKQELRTKARLLLTIAHGAAWADAVIVAVDQLATHRVTELTAALRPNDADHAALPQA